MNDNLRWAIQFIVDTVLILLLLGRGWDIRVKK